MVGNRAFASRQRKGLWEKGSKIIEAERQKDKQVREICKKHFLADSGI